MYKKFSTEIENLFLTGRNLLLTHVTIFYEILKNNDICKGKQKVNSFLLNCAEYHLKIPMFPK